MKHEFTLKKQIGQKGFFCTIIFEIDYQNTKANCLTYSFEAENFWKSSCDLGVQVFYDYFIRTKNGELNIQILEVKWFPVDSNILLVLYAVVKGLCEALELEVPNLNFDEIRLTYNFPDCRTFSNKITCILNK